MEQRYDPGRGFGPEVDEEVPGRLQIEPGERRIGLDVLRSGTGAGAVATILSRGFLHCVHMSGSERRAGRVGPDAVFVQKPFTDMEFARAIDDAMAISAAA